MTRSAQGSRIILGLLLAVSILSPVRFVRSEDAKPKAQLVVFAAASLTESFKEFGKQFETRHPNATVTFNFGASNQLRFQIEQGAKADLFASANTKEMEALVRSGGANKDASKTFARNRLVLLFPKDNPVKLAAIEDLAKPGIKLIIADKAVPVGNYTLQMLDKMTADGKFGATFKDSVLKNVVSEEDNVKSVVAKVRLGQGDAGIAYVSDMISAAKEVGTLEIADAYNPIAVYPIVALSKAAQPDLAKDFIDELLSSAGQEIIRKNGFMPAEDKKKE